MEMLIVPNQASRRYEEAIAEPIHVRGWKSILVGTGGHAKVILDIVRDRLEFNIVGVTTSHPEKISDFYGYPVLGDNSVWEACYRRGVDSVFLGVGGFRDNELRKSLYLTLERIGFTILNAIHPSALISETVRVGNGVVISPGVVANTDVSIGNNVILSPGSVIDHETKIGDHVLISTGVTIGGYVTIGDGALIALGAKIVSGVTIGQNALIAAGSVVVQDVGAGEKVFGVPAKPRTPPLDRD
jgi:UDP-perosamine 4-acetyltransferase